jgi:hypothetical protein
MTATRKAMRGATVALLKAGVPALGERVWAQRTIPLSVRQLPAAVVYCLGEQISVLGESTKHHSRRVRLAVHLVDHGFDDVDDRLDDLATVVERVMYDDSTLGGTVADVTLTAVEGPDLTADGERVEGELRLIYEAVYDTEHEADEDALENLEAVRVEYETHAPRAGAEAVDLVEVEVAP